jgi:CheY-like chemotaxis protein
MAARILVADDSVTIQKVVELTFSKEDFVLIPARSGEEAIRKAKEVQPDLILLDLVMPDKSGYEVCTALRAEPTLRTVPIIMLTGTFEAFDKDQGLRAGANDFVTKPFESQLLITKVKQLLFAKTVETGAPPAAPPRVGAPPVAPGVPPAAGPARPVTPPPPVAAAAPPLSGELPTLELPTLELEPISGGPKPAGAEASLFPEGLSLEELLAPATVPSPEPAGAKPPPGSAETPLEGPLAPTPFEGLLAEGESVFDLTADTQAPSLPLVEVGKGEPPAPSVEDLVDRGEVAPARAAAAGPPEEAPDVVRLEGLVAEGESVFDLTADMQAPSLPLVEVGKGEPPALSVEDLLSPAGTAPVEAAVGAAPEIQIEPPSVQARMPTPPAGPPDISELVEAAAAAAPLAPAAPLMAEVLATPPPTPPSAAMTPEMGTLRQAVTERVAHELAKELSGQLIERIERIVWEVVPDLAEILINKEIERIRAMAEGKQPS